MHNKEYRYSTERLLVCEWRSTSPDDWNQEELAVVVKNILTPKVTQSLPPAWQGNYTSERASSWIEERDDEATTLLVIEKSTRTAIGFIILFNCTDGRDIRLGYLLAEIAWGKGLASELIGGFVEWCKKNAISSVTGGVESDNNASKRVLEKNGFVAKPLTNDKSEQMFVLRINQNHDYRR